MVENYIYHKKNQNIKNKIPLNILYDFICKNAEECETNKFLINKEFYKRSKLNNSLNIFLKTLKEYYHISKQTYIDKCDNYKKFLTIIRQLCKYFDISYENKVAYFTSNYEKQYTVTFTSKYILNMRYQLRTNVIESSSSSNEFDELCCNNKNFKNSVFGYDSDDVSPNDDRSPVIDIETPILYNSKIDLTK